MNEKLIPASEPAIAQLESISIGSHSRDIDADTVAVLTDSSTVAFDKFLTEYVGKVCCAAEKIGGPVNDVTNVLNDAFRVQKELLFKIKHTKKPDMVGMEKFLNPIHEKLTEALNMSEGSRSVYYNHLKAVSDSLTALGWIACGDNDCGMRLPVQHVLESWNAAEIYYSKVLESKDANHVEWARGLKEIYVPGLRDYVDSYYPFGPVWSATGSAPPKPASKPGAPVPPAALLFTSESSQPSSLRPNEGMFVQGICSKPVTAGRNMQLPVLPYDVVELIVSMQPVKSMVRWKSVSKQWNTRISCKKFIQNYTKLHTKQTSQFLWYEREQEHGKNIECCLISYDTTSKKYVCHPLIFKLLDGLKLEGLKVVGVSHGLVCFVNQAYNGLDMYPRRAYVVNNSTGKLVTIDLHVPDEIKISTCLNVIVRLGFNVVPESLEPKLVQICLVFEAVFVDVFSMHSKTWKRSKTAKSTVPLGGFKIYDDNVGCSGRMHWVGCWEGEGKFILSFDVGSEAFLVTNFSNDMSFLNLITVSAQLYQLNGQTVLVSTERLFEGLYFPSKVESNARYGDKVYSVFLLEDEGEYKYVLKKLYSLVMPNVLDEWLIGFLDNGSYLVFTVGRKLVAYDRHKKTYHNLVLDAIEESFQLHHSYSTSSMMLA